MSLGQIHVPGFSGNICDERFESAGWEVTLCLFCTDEHWL